MSKKPETPEVIDLNEPCGLDPAKGETPTRDEVERELREIFSVDGVENPYIGDGLYFKDLLK